MNTTELNIKPLGYSFRIAENIWAGEYTVWDYSSYIRQSQLRTLTNFGIDYFIDLTEYREMPTYAELLPANIKRDTFPLPNGGIPKSTDEVRDLFLRIQENLKNHPDLKLYIHCHGGVGRTGTIVACYYIFFEHLSADEAIEKMRARFRYHGRSAWMTAPETKEQEEFIYKFAESL